MNSNPQTLPIASFMTAQDALEKSETLAKLVDGVMTTNEATEEFVIRARVEEWHRPLGLTFDEWHERYVGARFKRSIEARRDKVIKLAEDGLSQRQIADVVGVSQKTVESRLGC